MFSIVRAICVTIIPDLKAQDFSIKLVDADDVNLALENLSGQPHIQLEGCDAHEKLNRDSKDPQHNKGLDDESRVAPIVVGEGLSQEKSCHDRESQDLSHALTSELNQSSVFVGRGREFLQLSLQDVSENV